MIQFRKTKTWRGLRLTATKRGVGVSAGAGPLRVSVGSDGKIRRTWRAGDGLGVYDTKVVGQLGEGQQQAAPATQLHLATPPADDTELCTRWQRALVRGRLRNAELRGRLAGFDPVTKALTTGQAEQLLAAVGEDPHKLYVGGRTWGKKG